MTQLDDAIHLIEQACTPVELFGPPNGDSAARTYRLLARITHPDMVQDGRSGSRVRQADSTLEPLPAKRLVLDPHHPPAHVCARPAHRDWGDRGALSGQLRQL